MLTVLFSIQCCNAQDMRATLLRWQRPQQKKLRLVHRRRTGPCRRNFLLLSQRRAGRDFVSSSPFQFAFEVQTPDVTVQVFLEGRERDYLW
jgi:hypothetical protein